MKRTIYSIAAIVLMASLLVGAGANAAPVKAGVNCSKLGNTAISDLKKFTCVKVAKKLVWNKGVAITSKPKASATPTPSPSATLTPLSYAKLDNTAVLTNVRLIVDEQIKKSTAAAVNIKLALGPSLTSNEVVNNLASVQRVLNVFAAVHKPTTFYVNLFKSEDADWVDQAITESGGDSNSTPTRILYSQWMKQAPNCNMGNATIGRKGPLFNQCLSPNAPAFTALETSSHETFHTFQQAVAGYSTPVWFSEGGATFIGIHFGPYGTSDYSTNRDQTLRRYFTNAIDSDIRTAINAKDKAGVVSRFKLLEARDVDSSVRNSAYLFGALLSEVLIAVEGWDKWVALHTGTPSKGFAENFKSVYGMSLDEFYPIASDYLISQR
jgi:hypothetical protein